MDRRREAREFLVSRRARLTPEQVGLRTFGDRPRRVAGLRREEVAELAGLSVPYFVKLERGDLEGASDSVLEALARALRLDEAERLHLLGLARPRGVAGAGGAPHRLWPSLLRVVDGFTGGPALVRNRRWDYLAANALARATYAEIFDGTLPGPPNHVRYVFLDPRSRRFFEGWDAVAHDLTRLLRSEAGQDRQDHGPEELVEELLGTSAEFAAAWARQDVRLPATAPHAFVHPTVGRLELVFDSAALRADPALTLLLATPEPGSPTEDALRRLRGAPD